jgi:hypothetical protein
MTNNVVAEVVWPGLRGSCRSISRGHSDAGIRLVFGATYKCKKTYTTMKTAMKTDANPAQVIHANFSNLRTLAHRAIMMAAMMEK